MKHLSTHFHFDWSQGPAVQSTTVAICFLAISLAANYIANVFATARQSSAVTDIILSNLPSVDVDGAIVVGVMLLALLAIWLLLSQPQRIPFILKSVALFVLIRAAFISMTHLGPFPVHTDIPTSLFLRTIGLDSGADLFFSGHTGMPFLFALIFWNNLQLRATFLLGSVFFGVAMLLGHLHYTIDVCAAFFITYGIFHLALQLFPNDYQIFSKTCLPTEQ